MVKLIVDLRLRDTHKAAKLYQIMTSQNNFEVIVKNLLLTKIREPIRKRWLNHFKSNLKGFHVGEYFNTWPELTKNLQVLETFDNLENLSLCNCNLFDDTANDANGVHWLNSLFKKLRNL